MEGSIRLACQIGPGQLLPEAYIITSQQPVLAKENPIFIMDSATLPGHTRRPFETLALPLVSAITKSKRHFTRLMIIETAHRRFGALSCTAPDASRIVTKSGKRYDTKSKRS